MFFEGWDVSQETNRLILVLIWIIIQIQEILR